MSEHKKVVLIVDDEPGMRDMLRWSLDGAKFEVKLARDGREALAILALGGVDVVVTDLTMPNLDGFEFLEAMKARPSRTAVIVITGFATVEMAVHAMRLGAADVLLKPFDSQELENRIREVIFKERDMRIRNDDELMKRKTLRSTLAAAWVAALFLSAAAAFAQEQISHVVIGRLTHPKDVWMLHSNWEQAAPRWRDSSQDTVASDIDVEYGVTDDLTLGAGMSAADASRGQTRFDLATVEAAYMLPVSYLQVAPDIQATLSTRGLAPQWEFRLPVMKNIGMWSLLGHASLTREAGPSGLMTGHELEVWSMRRLGLASVAGIGWNYSNTKRHMIEFPMGGAVGQNIFLAIEPMFGLTPSSADFALRVQLHFIYGPYSFGAWSME